MAKIHFPIRFSTLDTIVPIGQAGHALSSESMTLAKAVASFISEDVHVRAAQSSRIAAGNLGTTTVKALYKYLIDLDFDAEILVGKRYLKQLLAPSPSIQLLVEEIGHQNAAASITHGVVRVNDLVLDLLYQKIGTTYKQYNNFPLSEFEQYWMYVLDVKSLADMTPDHVKKLIADASKDKNLHLPPVRKPAPTRIPVEDKTLIFLDRRKAAPRHTHTK